MSLTLDPAYARQLRAAQGYAELGMIPDALAELDDIAPEFRSRLEAYVLRLEILQAAKRWPEGASAGREALELFPGCGALYLMTAFAVRRSQGLEEAKALLTSAENLLAEDAMFHYNLGCYECLLGNRRVAETRLLRALHLDPKYREIGMKDEDLQAMWEWLATCGPTV